MKIKACSCIESKQQLLSGLLGEKYFEKKFPY